MDIAVVVPTYNRGDLIGETLSSIKAQSFKPAEVIVVDDGSSDDTERVVKETDPCVKYLRIENSGECRARNVGVDASSAAWVAFCDSDDLWLPDRLMRQVELLREAPEIEYCFTNFRTVTEGEWSKETKFDTSPRDYWKLARRSFGPDSFVVEEPLFGRLLIHQPIFPSTLLMGRSFFNRVGRWNEPLGRTPSVDLEFHLRCAGRGGVGVVSSPVVGIRKHRNNFSGNPLRTTIGEVAVLRYVLEHNPDAKPYAHTIEEQIVMRGAEAAGAAFSIGDFVTMRQMLGSVPRERRSFKLRCKEFLASCPKPLRQAIQTAASSLRQSATGC